jgi:hypothetical protein
MAITIRAAAIRFNGVVYEGKNHASIIRTMVELHGIKKPTIDNEQGFTTSNRKYVNRTTAAKIALDAGQVTTLKYSTTQLYSEDFPPGVLGSMLSKDGKRQFKGRCQVDGRDDSADLTSTFEVIRIRKDKIYEEHFRDGKPSGYVIDDNACWNKIGDEMFDVHFDEVL